MNRPARSLLLAAAILGASSGGMIAANTTSAYVQQNCGTQSLSTGTASASVSHISTQIASCGMKASVRCKRAGVQDQTNYISSGSQTAAGQTRTRNCSTGWTRYANGHQEGTNW